MMAAYRTGDPYLEFARMAGAVPSWATAQTHPEERAAFKVCMLATQYGMSEFGLAAKLNKPVAFARNLLAQHRRTFPVYWNWSEQRVKIAMLTGRIRTVFGLPIHTVGGDNPRFLANFSMQGNGAELLRLACCMVTEAGIQVCCPVHDAILIEAPTGSIEETVNVTQRLMREASRIVLDGFELESDVKIVRSPERYQDEDRGLQMWNRVMSLAHQAEHSSLLTR